MRWLDIYVSSNGDLRCVSTRLRGMDFEDHAFAFANWQDLLANVNVLGYASVKVHCYAN